MSPSLKNISKRTADKARSAAAGSTVPAGQEPPSPEAAVTPVTAERGSMRKRARRLTRMREVLLRELGALMVEMRRLERDNPELVARKAAEVLVIDEQLRGLREALGERQTVEQVVAAGVAGSCARCSTLMAIDDRFCPRCGLAVAEPGAAESAARKPAAAKPASSEPVADAGAAEPAASEPVVGSAEAAEPEPAAAEAAGAEPPESAAPPPPPPPPPPSPSPSPHRAQDELTATAPPKP